MRHAIGAPRAHTQRRRRENATLLRPLRARIRVTFVILVTYKDFLRNRYSLPLRRMSWHTINLRLGA
jgi:hypothetical protein